MELIISEDFGFPYDIYGLIYRGVPVLQIAGDSRGLPQMEYPRIVRYWMNVNTLLKEAAEFTFSFLLEMESIASLQATRGTV